MQHRHASLEGRSQPAILRVDGIEDAQPAVDALAALVTVGATAAGILRRHVGVQVDHAWHDVARTTVDDEDAARCLERPSDGGDLAAGNQNVRRFEDPRLRHGVNAGATNQYVLCCHHGRRAHDSRETRDR